MDLDLFFSKLAITFQLGGVLSKPVILQGGLIHQVYKLHTTQGTYAVKLLNPNIMKRPKAIANFLEADSLELLLQKKRYPNYSSPNF